MEPLKRAVQLYAAGHANYDGLALTPVPGLRMMCADRPSGPMHSIYKPLVCLVLQGAKQMTIGDEQHEFRAGEWVVMTLDLPVTGRIVQASADAPYLAVAVELDAALIHELADEFVKIQSAGNDTGSKLFVTDPHLAALDCVMRLMRLLDTPTAIPLLQPAIMRELHFWMLSGRHREVIRRIVVPDGQAERLGSAIRLLRTEYRHRLALERLAAAAGMSVTTFGRRFKAMTSLTPLQFQKQLRLVEARRLMLGEGLSVTNAALAVGYESAAHFTRDFSRLFGAPPKRNARRPNDSGAAEQARPSTSAADELKAVTL